MHKLSLYESRAEHAEPLARIAQTDEERAASLQSAAVWREIARTRRPGRRVFRPWPRA